MRSISSAALIVVLAVVTGATGCARESDDASVGDRVVTGAKTVIVTEAPFAETVEANGMVSGRPDRMAMLSTPGTARIAAVHVVVGQQVKRGDALVELDQVTFRAAVNAADAALAAAEAQQARLLRLSAAGIAARRDVEMGTAELAAARAAAETAHRQAELSVLRSPIAGVVTRVTAVLGATADPALTLVQVADGRALDLELNVPPAQAAVLSTGARVEILGHSRGSTTLGDGVVTTVGGVVDSATRAVTVRAAVRRTTAPLAIGMMVPVRIVAATRPKALVVPIEALVPDGESFKVFVVDAAGIAHSRAVEVGGRTETVAEIRRGLAAGERIVTYGAYGMDDSVKVAPAGKAPAAPAPDSK